MDPVSHDPASGATRILTNGSQAHTLGPGRHTGSFQLRPGGPVRSLAVDGTSDGGGWILVLKNDCSGHLRTDRGYNIEALSSDVLSGIAVLPRDEIEALGDTFRVIGYLPEQKTARLFWKGLSVYTTDAHPFVGDRAAIVDGLRSKYAWDHREC